MRNCLRTIPVALVFVGLIFSPASAKPKKQDRSLSKDRLQIGGRLYTLWSATNDLDQPANSFAVDSVRLKLEWRKKRQYRARLQVDFEMTEEDPNSVFVLRDAYVRWDTFKAFQVQVGQFKRPFSRLELRGRRRLEVIERGPGNGWLVGDLGYGDRDVGLMALGEFGDGAFGYSLGFFNGPGRNHEEQDLDGTKDVVLRFEGEPARWLSLGVNGALKMFDPNMEANEDKDSRFAWAGGADLRLSPGGGFSLLAEGLYGENHLAVDKPAAWIALMLATWKIPGLPFKVPRIQPTVKVEMTTPDSSLDDAAIWAVSPGVNLYLWKRLRILMQGDLRWAGDDARSLGWKDEKRFMVLMAFDI